MKTAFRNLIEIPGVIITAAGLIALLVWEFLTALYAVAVLGESPDEEGKL